MRRPAHLGAYSYLITSGGMFSDSTGPTDPTNRGRATVALEEGEGDDEQFFEASDEAGSNITHGTGHKANSKRLIKVALTLFNAETGPQSPDWDGKVRRGVCLAVRSVRPAVLPPCCPSACLSVRLSVRLSVCPSVCLSV